MPINISFTEAIELLKRLHSESVKVGALFITSSQDRTRIRGFVRGVSVNKSLVIASTPEGDEGSFLEVAMPDFKFGALYGDRREFAPVGHPATDEAAVERWGDNLLTLDFPGERSLALYFTL